MSYVQDLVKETASFYKKARKFYDALAGQLVRQGHALDIFACSLDQARTGDATLTPSVESMSRIEAGCLVRSMARCDYCSA